MHIVSTDTCYFVLTYENEQFCLSGPFNLNSLVKKVTDIYRLDDCINDGKQNISHSLFCSSAVSKCIYRKMKYTCSVAPGENKHRVSFMMDKQFEELTWVPVLFPKGSYGYTTKREIKLTPTKYFMRGYFISIHPGDVGWMTKLGRCCTVYTATKQKS